MKQRSPKVLRFGPQHEQYNEINRLTAEQVVGYSADAARVALAAEVPALEALFAGTGLSVPHSSAVAIYSAGRNGTLMGAAMLEPRYNAALAQAEPEMSRAIATIHTVLAGMFVLPEHRRRGVGRALLRAVRDHLENTGVRYLEGFSDERGASAGFYAAIGAHVMLRDAPIPPRSPTEFEAAPPHHLGIRGHWFYFDLYRDAMHETAIYCSECREDYALKPDEPGAPIFCACSRAAATHQ